MCCATLSVSPGNNSGGDERGSLIGGERGRPGPVRAHQLVRPGSRGRTGAGSSSGGRREDAGRPGSNSPPASVNIFLAGYLNMD